MISLDKPTQKDRASMLSGEDIICFTLRPWQSTWKTDQQIMARLAVTNRVLYVNPPRGPRAALRHLFTRMPGGSVSAVTGRGVHLFQEPIFLPQSGRSHLLSRAYNRVADPARLILARNTAKALGFRSPILWSINPLAYRAVGMFSEKLVVYSVIDNYDEYFSTPGEWCRRAREDHREMMRRADVVFAVSPRLLEVCLQYNQNSYLVPNGVSYELFEPAVRNSSVPPEVRQIRRPIIGYIGVISSCIDISLLEKVTRAHPDWSLMLVGPVEDTTREDMELLSQLRLRSNVWFLGPKPPDVLPYYFKCCDVGLIPYRVDMLTSFIDSLKMYEYLASGKPVVSTAIDSARRLGSYVEIAVDPPGFVAAIERALERPDIDREARMSLAKSNSWAQRIGEMSATLAAYLQQPSGT